MAKCSKYSFAATAYSFVAFKMDACLHFSLRIIANFRHDDYETQSCITALLLSVFGRDFAWSSGFAFCVGMESGEDVLVGCAAGGAETL
jgi:hypothetical protein